MAVRITRSITEPLREKLTFSQRWDQDDRGLITCWERGRVLATTHPELAQRAIEGDLVELPWKRGSWHYLAMWQGLRNTDLNVDTSAEILMSHSYIDSKGENKTIEIHFPESGTCPSHLKTLKAKNQDRRLYFDDI